ncbi:hypothetical protein [Rhodococcus gordoniae]|uniref:hypothetical protein n=1 Tax=Rhodococcus gordoniae TaxID=223392 RepID=UPI003F64C254
MECRRRFRPRPGDLQGCGATPGEPCREIEEESLRGRYHGRRLAAADRAYRRRFKGTNERW